MTSVRGRRSFVAVPARADVAIGSRESAGARRIGEPEVRHVMGRAFNALVRAALVADFRDTQCGFKLFTAAAAEVAFRTQTISGWAFDLEALFQCRRAGLRVVELPIDWHDRDESRVSPLSDSLRMARDVCRIRWNALGGRYQRRGNPGRHLT